MGYAAERYITQFATTHRHAHEARLAFSHRQIGRWGMSQIGARAMQRGASEALPRAPGPASTSPRTPRLRASRVAPSKYASTSRRHAEAHGSERLQLRERRVSQRVRKSRFWAVLDTRLPGSATAELPAAAVAAGGTPCLKVSIERRCASSLRCAKRNAPLRNATAQPGGIITKCADVAAS